VALAPRLTQDYINIRNWLASVADQTDLEATSDEDAFLVRHALNDGPESLVFIPAADSSIGKPPLAPPVREIYRDFSRSPEIARD
jgi:hypothetical protein